MLAVVFIISCLAVCGFYIYVLVQFQQEQRHENERQKHFSEHLLQIGFRPKTRKDPYVSSATSNHRTGDSQRLRKDAALRRETMLDIGFSIAGLLALFAGIELLNSLVNWLR